MGLQVWMRRRHHWAWLVTLLAIPAFGQLNENCTVSILNRTIRVDSDGSWRLNNLPVGFGPVRARATCAGPGSVTQAGQTSFVSLALGQTNAFDADVVLGVVDPVPQFLTLTAQTTTLTTIGATTQLTVTATFADDSTGDVTSPLLGTSYNITNPAIATVSNSGLVTAVSSGAVLVSSMNDGALGVIQLQVMLDGADSDGDGIPDDIEVTFGLNPNDPSDAQLDLDGDGLTNLAEFNLGTTINNPDSDGDGIQDGEETVAGADGFVTNPLLAGTDGDGIRDGLEIATLSDPTDGGSFNLAGALSSVSISPSSFVLVAGLLQSAGTEQLVVTGNLIDGSTIDLTERSKGTQYTTNNARVCGFDSGSPDGLLVGRMAGLCVVNVSNDGFSTVSVGAIQEPYLQPLSVLPIPGFANNVDVNGNYAYVAGGQAGMQVVDVSDRENPQILTTLDTPGNANDIEILGDFAYVADGVSGLQIIDISDPSSPQIAGSADTSGVAQDVVVRGTVAFVADDASGLQIIDVTNTASPAVIGTVDTPGTAKGVDADPARQIAVVADGSGGLQAIDIASPASPQIVGNVPGFADARVVVLDEDVAYVGDFSFVVSVVAVGVADPSVPDVFVTIFADAAGVPNDLALRENLLFTADGLLAQVQNTEIPIVDVNDPSVRAETVDFSVFQNEHLATGIAIDSNYAYLTAATVAIENGATGDSYLYIGQYLDLEDSAGIPPLTQITSPAPGTTVPEGAKLPVTVEATDDSAVALVEFLLDGQVVFRDTTAPYQFLVSIPSGVSSAILGARAIDLGGNLGVASDVLINVIPDPLTTVTGRVLDPDSNPVNGASVEVFGTFTSFSGVDGTFSIPSVPTVTGAIRVHATATAGGQFLAGASSSFAPVLGGTTNGGDIVLGRLPLFTGQKTFIGDLPAAIILADVNLDGIEDVVTANEGPDDVSVALGNPNGSFQPAASFPAGGGIPSLFFADGPFSVAAGDLNGDGLTDLVTANAPRTTFRSYWAMATAHFSNRYALRSTRTPIRITSLSVTSTATRPWTWW